MAYLLTDTVPAFSAATYDLSPGDRLVLPAVQTSISVLPGDRVPLRTRVAAIVAALRGAERSDKPTRLVMLATHGGHVFGVGILAVVASVSITGDSGDASAVVLATLPVAVVRLLGDGTAAVVEVLREHAQAPRLDCAATRLPAFVWRAYEPRGMCARLLRRDIFRGCLPSGSSIFSAAAAPDGSPVGSSDPVSVSWLLARNLPLLETERRVLLAAAGVVARLDLLRRVVDSLLPRVVCAACGAPVCPLDAIDARMLGEASALFVNPAGRLFRVALASGATLGLAGPAATLDATWFDGYGWTIAVCADCSAHIGWRFDWMGARAPPRVEWNVGAEEMRYDMDAGGEVPAERPLREWAAAAGMGPPPHGCYDFVGLLHGAVVVERRGGDDTESSEGS